MLDTTTFLLITFYTWKFCRKMSYQGFSNKIEFILQNVPPPNHLCRCFTNFTCSNLAQGALENLDLAMKLQIEMFWNHCFN